jgi:hypothetical protein
MKKFLAAALLLMVFSTSAFARTKHHRPPKPLHKNAPHQFTKHKAAQHPTVHHPTAQHSTAHHSHGKT